MTEDPRLSHPVDLVLDIGNSRSCGILIEEHRDDNKGLSQLYQLQLRDLSQPQNVYNEPSTVAWSLLRRVWQAGLFAEKWSQRRFHLADHWPRR
ncbi:virulence factor SrfB [Leclercia adecarboxylata]|uniref:virulence factor SrfB n=1 Tax=Leclercia adecarboxylata TaxID=83655 RepID=UPI00223941D1|nr:virulence factor SrfB [Leclercia adecarboxylata]